MFRVYLITDAGWTPYGIEFHSRSMAEEYARNVPPHLRYIISKVR
jgi:hypothetical protein